MADWESLTGSPGNVGSDFLSLYMSQSGSTPLHQQNGTSELQFSPSPAKVSASVRSAMTLPSSLMDDHHHVYHQNSGAATFCHKDNIDHCVSFLNQEVTSLGHASLYEHGGASHDTVRLINCTYELLQRHQRSLRLRDEMENRLHRNESDIEHLHQCQNRLKATIEIHEREVVQTQEKERQLKNKNKLLGTKLKAEKDEVKRLQSAIAHRDAQYKHELKKKERESSKLKDRLHQLITDRTDRRIGMVIANNLQRADGSRGKWGNPNRHEEEMYRGVIGNYEEKQKELMVENHELRQSLAKIQQELVTTLSPGKFDGVTETSSHSEDDVFHAGGTDDEVEEESENLTNGFSSNITENVLAMPYDLVREHVEKSLKEKCKKLKKYINKIERQHNNSKRRSDSSSSRNEHKAGLSGSNEWYETELEKLNSQIDRYRAIMEQQETLLQSQLEEQAEGTSSGILDESGLWEDKKQIERDRELFSVQQAHFEEERRRFTEAAIRLSHERKAFEDQKAAFLTSQFSSLTPFSKKQRPASASAVQTNSTLKTGGRRTGSGSRLLPSTPSFSPAPISRSLHTRSPTMHSPLHHHHHPQSTLTAARNQHHHSLANKQRPHSTPLGGQSRHHHHIGAFTPVSAGPGRSQLKTPSTADLYRHLGLTVNTDKSGSQSGIPMLNIDNPNTGSARHTSHTAGDIACDRSPEARVAQHIDALKQCLFQPPPGGAGKNTVNAAEAGDILID